MSWLFFSVATALLWGTAELFYKKGALPNEKYSHLKICVWVGVVMGAHAIFTLLTQDIGYNPMNLLIYLPVSLFYIISMAFSYFGMRFLEESISDPIENTAGVICTLLFVIFLKEEISPLTWVAIGIITVGVLGVSFLENRGETTRKKTYGKKLAIVAFCMPFVYALLDAFGTFLDDAFFLVEDIADAPFVDVTEETIEAVANTSYELTFALFALGLFIFMKSKKVKFGPVPQHKDKILAAVFETAGQFTYVYALGGVDAIAAPILSSVCVVSLLLSRIFLKEKLNWKTYVFITIVIVGILLMAVAEEL
ncbi:MAG: DMT family transporter [Oscillospiraceae bacterium]|nr:DMT family transporter [Oscillospiraceae bacterium]MBQ7130433.1 DMT family transporter [Oscillospiraceae bacterium]